MPVDKICTLVNKLIGYLYQSVKFVQLNIHRGRELTNGAIKFKFGEINLLFGGGKRT